MEGGIFHGGLIWFNETIMGYKYIINNMCIYIYIWLVVFRPTPLKNMMGWKSVGVKGTSQLFLESHQTCSSHHQPPIPSSLSLQISSPIWAKQLRKTPESCHAVSLTRIKRGNWKLSSIFMLDMFQKNDDRRVTTLTCDTTAFFSRPLCGHVLSTLQPLRHKGRCLSFHMHGMLLTWDPFKWLWKTCCSRGP